jgi:hypothetical protein
MAFVPVPDCCLARIHLKATDNLATIGVWFRKAGFDTDDLTDLAVALLAGLVADILAELSADVNAFLIELIGQRTREDIQLSFPCDIDGGQTAKPSAAWGNACCVSLKTAKRGKWNQGRVYIPGIAEEESDLDEIALLTTQGLEQAFQNVIDDPPEGWEMVVVSRYLDGEPRTLALTQAVTNPVVRSRRWAFQRRRQRRS